MFEERPTSGYDRASKPNQNPWEPHMQPSENQPIRQYWQLCQQCLFPVLEERLGPLSENYRRLAAALAWLGDAGIAAPPRKAARPPLARSLADIPGPASQVLSEFGEHAAASRTVTPRQCVAAVMRME